MLVACDEGFLYSSNEVVLITEARLVLVMLYVKLRNSYKSFHVVACSIIRSRARARTRGGPGAFHYYLITQYRGRALLCNNSVFPILSLISLYRCRRAAMLPGTPRAHREKRAWVCFAGKTMSGVGQLLYT